MTKALIKALPLMLFSPLALAATSLPQINLREVIRDIVILVIVGVVLGIIHFWVSSAPFIKEPIRSLILWGIIGAGCLIAIYLLLGWIGM